LNNPSAPKGGTDYEEDRSEFFTAEAERRRDISSYLPGGLHAKALRENTKDAKNFASLRLLCCFA
jgi:hypothetical protein